MEVLLIDDHPLICDILIAMLRKLMGSEAVVHVAGTLEAGLECARNCKRLDLVLLDLGLPGCSGIEALRRFREKCPDQRVVVVSANDERESILRALDNGAAGYIPKTSSPPTFLAALRLVLDGGTYNPQEALGARIGGTAGEDLSEREQQVLRLVLKGLSNREIARQLDIAENTVKHHIGEIYQSFGVTSRAEAMAAATRRGYKPAL